MDHSTIFFSPEGREEAVVSSSEVCRKDDEGRRREGGVALTQKAAFTWGAQAKALIILSEADRKAAERDVADWKRIKPFFSLSQPAQNLFEVPYSGAAARGDKELGDIAPSLDVSIRVLGISLGCNQELLETEWNFTGNDIKFFSVFQSLSYIRTNLS